MIRRHRTISDDRTQALDELMEAFERFHERMMALHAPELIELQLTLAQLKAVYFVTAMGPIRMSSLAVQLGTALSTTSGVVDRLVHDGLLERGEDRDDRRQVLVSATPKARQLVDEASEIGRDRMRRLLERLPTADDMKTVTRAFGLLSGAANDMNEDANT